MVWCRGSPGLSWNFAKVSDCSWCSPVACGPSSLWQWYAPNSMWIGPLNHSCGTNMLIFVRGDSLSKCRNFLPFWRPRNQLAFNFASPSACCSVLSNFMDKCATVRTMWHKSCRLRLYPRALQIVCSRKSWSWKTRKCFPVEYPRQIVVGGTALISGSLR